MIIGLGTDLINVKRIEDLYTHYGERFEERILTAEERESASQRSGSEKFFLFLAKKYAAKEALSKALGTGIGKKVSFKEINVSNDKAGKPTIELSGSAKDTLDKLTIKGKSANIYVSISDDPPFAVAVVVISCD